MGKNKLRRFAENENSEYIIQPDAEVLLNNTFNLRGRWHEHFGNDHPLVAELGCGKGEYTIALAEDDSTKNFIGIDIKGARLWAGTKAAEEKKLTNAAFLRSRVDFIDRLFGPGELSELWITFPDPQPQKPRERKRLTSPRFLNRYLKVLKPGGSIHLKTDNIHFFDYTLEVIRAHHLPLHACINDLHRNHDSPERLTSIRTFYENIFLSQDIPIHYLEFGLSGKPLEEGQSRAIAEVTYRSRGR